MLVSRPVSAPFRIAPLLPWALVAVALVEAIFTLVTR